MRKEVKPFYNSKEWEKTRAYILMRDNYLCVKCGRPAREVHHIKHVTAENVNDPSITMNPDNLMSLCRDCHFEKHRGEHANGRKNEESYAYEFDDNGQLVPKSNK